MRVFSVFFLAIPHYKGFFRFRILEHLTRAKPAPTSVALQRIVQLVAPKTGTLVNLPCGALHQWPRRTGRRKDAYHLIIDLQVIDRTFLFTRIRSA